MAGLSWRGIVAWHEKVGADGGQAPCRERAAMLSYREQEWWWGDQPLGLMDPEPDLLLAMLRERGLRRPPHLWLALQKHQPYAPATGRAFLSALIRKLEWAEAPAGLIQVDPLLGCVILSDIAISDDPETLAILEPLTEEIQVYSA
jgi:hypothetical protein